MISYKGLSFQTRRSLNLLSSWVGGATFIQLHFQEWGGGRNRRKKEGHEQRKRDQLWSLSPPEQNGHGGGQENMHPCIPKKEHSAHSRTLIHSFPEAPARGPVREVSLVCAVFQRQHTSVFIWSLVELCHSVQKLILKGNISIWQWGS